MGFKASMACSGGIILYHTSLAPEQANAIAPTRAIAAIAAAIAVTR